MTWALRTEADTDAVNLHLDRLQAAGLLGVSEEGGRATLWFPDRPAGIGVQGRWEEVADRDWNAAWREGIEPVTVGRVTVTPPWIAAGGDVVLVIEPGQAFGTGHHETTTGCLAALGALDLVGARVCDVGTGTGVLAIAAARLGAAAVVAVDTDPVATAAARRNAAGNATAVDVRDGSTEAVAGEAFDVVVANLDTSTIVRLAGGLVGLVTPGGTLIASGVSRERQHEAADALAGAGLPVEVTAGREWVVLVGRRPAAAPPHQTGARAGS